MMWLGRADTGWNVLPPHPTAGLRGDSDRELCSAGVLAFAMHASEALGRLRAVDDLIALLVGRGDTLNLPALLAVMGEADVRAPGDLADEVEQREIRLDLAPVRVAVDDELSPHDVPSERTPLIGASVPSGQAPVARSQLILSARGTSAATTVRR